MDETLQTNAADPRQVAHAKRKLKDSRRQQVNDLLAVLKTPEGRRVMWRLLEECKVFGSVMAPEGTIQYNAGRQDFGHFLMAEIEHADDQALFTMMREHRDRKRKAAVEHEAVRTERRRESE